MSIKQKSLMHYFNGHPLVTRLFDVLKKDAQIIHLKGLNGSSTALVAASLFEQPGNHQFLIVIPDKEQAAYFYNDVENFFGEANTDYNKKKVLFYPTSYKRPYEPENPDRTYQLSRTEVLKRYLTGDRKTIVVTYPEAMAEKVVTKKFLLNNTMKLKVGEEVSLDFVGDLLADFDFHGVDFVAEPGEFAVRGGIVDVFSFSNDHPYRIEFFGDVVESIRSFDPQTQLSVQKMNSITILPNVQDRKIMEHRVSLLDYLPKKTILWFSDFRFTVDQVNKEYEKAVSIFNKTDWPAEQLKPESLFIRGNQFINSIDDFMIVEFGHQFHFNNQEEIEFDQQPQPAFNKNFDLLINDLMNHSADGYTNLILSDNAKQTERLYAI